MSTKPREKPDGSPCKREREKGRIGIGDDLSFAEYWSPDLVGFITLHTITVEGFP